MPMHLVRNLHEYLSTIDMYGKAVVIGVNCSDCHTFLHIYGRCIDEHGFAIVVLPNDMDNDLLEFFYVNDLLCLPIVVVEGLHYCGDIDYLGSVVCGRTS
ncbi:MAG: hypothetical protein QXN35_07250 [Ignisphaera sp.]